MGALAPASGASAAPVAPAVQASAVTAANTATTSTYDADPDTNQAAAAASEPMVTAAPAEAPTTVPIRAPALFARAAEPLHLKKKEEGEQAVDMPAPGKRRRKKKGGKKGG